MKKIGINLHAALAFVFLAYLLRSKLEGDPHFPPSLYGKGMTQNLKSEFERVTFHLSTAHFTSLLHVDEETEDTTLKLLDLSLIDPLRQPAANSLGSQVRYPLARLGRDFPKLPNTARYEKICDAFFHAHCMAGTPAKANKFEDIQWPEIIDQLKFAFSCLADVRILLDEESLPWIIKYIEKMESAITRKH